MTTQGAAGEVAAGATTGAGRAPTRRGRSLPTAAPAGPHEWRPQRFMVIVAHPDDADFGPAATAARWIDAGSSGWLVCCTSGDAGGEDPDIDPLELAAIREAEQRAAAAIVGYAGVSFLHQPDGGLANDLVMRELLVREIRAFRPDAVLTHDPDVIFYRGGGVNHIDHRTAGLAAVDAVYPAARNPMAFPWLARGGLAAHRVRRLYLFWPDEPEVRVDVSSTIQRKIDALRAHLSQIHHPEELAERMLAWGAEEGEPIGAAAAEGFRLVVIEPDEPAPESEEAEGPTDVRGGSTAD
ncbi:MAG: PIG-L deacetylase family protein [Candidatus Limnocylindrales bacterium]